MKTILITSSGFLRKVIRDEILKILPGKRPLQCAYVSTASKVVKDDWYAQKDVEIMERLGIIVDEIDLAKVRHSELEARFEGKDFIYVQGGNPYWLLKQVRESGFDGIIPGLIEAGVPYIGKSAGAMILAPEIVVPLWLRGEWRTFGVEDVTGLGLVPFVWAAHYTDSYKDILQEKARLCRYPVKAITNDQAYLVRGDTIQLVGVGEEITFAKE